MKVLFLLPYPLKQSPSQRFRFEQYFKSMDQASITYHTQSFLNSHNWQIFYSSGKVVKKLSIIILGFLKRFLILLKIYDYDFIFIHREAAPVGPPVIEWLITKILKKKIIYDFDDAIWMTDRKKESFLYKLFKSRNKVQKICGWAYKVSCGNQYLSNYSNKFNRSVVLNPTTIDTIHWHNPALYKTTLDTNKITIGWTGSHSTLKYLRGVESVIKILLGKYDHIQFIVIADRKPDLSFPFKFIPWNDETEIQDLMQIDIGIMPLPDDEWSKGKCGFKALQYMALKIPCVASPVGVNTVIVEQGINGYLAETENEWFTYLDLLIKDKSDRQKLGEQGRLKVVKHYSVTSNIDNFLSLFE